MKKLLIILCLVFFAGCANQNLPLRSQVRTGMTITQVWGLYGYDSSDPNTYNNVYYENIDEQIAEECFLKTYRFWFKNTRKSISAKPVPYLLTFQSCHLPNYAAVQKEKKRRIDRLKDAAINDPDFKKELDVFCKENQIDSEDREILFEVLAININKAHPLPQCMTDQTLIKLTLDQAAIRHRQNLSSIKGIENELERINTYNRFGY